MYIIWLLWLIQRCSPCSAPFYFLFFSQRKENNRIKPEHTEKHHQIRTGSTKIKLTMKHANWQGTWTQRKGNPKSTETRELAPLIFHSLKQLCIEFSYWPRDWKNPLLWIQCHSKYQREDKTCHERAKGHRWLISHLKLYVSPDYITFFPHLWVIKLEIFLELTM